MASAVTFEQGHEDMCDLENQDHSDIVVKLGTTTNPLLRKSATPRTRLAAVRTPAMEHNVSEAKVYLAPGEIYHHIVDAGAAKLKNSLTKETVLSVLAGIYIGFGFSLCMAVGGQLHELKAEEPGLYNMILGGFGFPFGLTLVIVCGAELFTSNVAYMTAAWIEGKTSFLGLLKIWFISYFGNLVGCLFLAQFMVWGDVFESQTIRPDFTISLAHKKTSYSFGVVLVKAIMANWLVCLAVWQANAAQDITGKAVGIWLPISAFVALGLEHCIANQFVIPFSIMLGSGIPISTFITHNLIPATIGNIIGGGFFVATTYGLSYGSLESSIAACLMCAWRWFVRKCFKQERLPTKRSVSLFCLKWTKDDEEVFRA